MISKKLISLLFITIPLLMLHGWEEYISKLYVVDPQNKFVFGYLYSLSTPEAVFLMFQIMLGLGLLPLIIAFCGEKWRLRVLIILGFIYIFQLQHLAKAILVGGYYPGLMTAFLFPIIGFFYWKELLRIMKNKS